MPSLRLYRNKAKACCADCFSEVGSASAFVVSTRINKVSLPLTNGERPVPCRPVKPNSNCAVQSAGARSDEQSLAEKLGTGNVEESNAFTVIPCTNASSGSVVWLA